MEKLIRKLYYERKNVSRGETNSGEVITQPDQSLSVNDILQRFTSGNILPIAKQPKYYDDEEAIDYDSELDDQVDDPTLLHTGESIIDGVFRNPPKDDTTPKKEGKEESPEDAGEGSDDGVGNSE